MTSKKRVKAVTIVCGTVAIGMWADAATAQSAPAPVAAEQDKESAPEILVTANRVQERQRDVALSVTALGGDTLAERRALTFEDYSALVPGLSLQSRGAGNTRVTLRGQNSGGSGSTVAIYIDESPIGSSTSLVQGAVATADLDPFDLQRVEVLRGPQGTLYGANAEGGVIKFVTNDPSFDRIAAAGQVSGFNVNKGQSDYGVRGWLNLPIVDDRVGLRVSAFREGVPGYVDNNYLNINDVNSGERYGFRGTLLVKPVDGLTIRLSALSQKSVIGGQPLEDLRTQTQPFTTDLTQTRYTRELQSSLVKNYSAIVAYDFGKVKLSSITSYGQITQQVNNDLGFSEIAPGFTYRDFVTGYYGQPATLKVAAVNSLDKLSQEFRISATIGRLDLQTGFFYTAEDGQVSQFANGIYLSDQSVAPGALAFGAYVNSHYKEYAGYGTATFHFTPNL
ncbi:MAG: TonB-dependent receptor plug domain-containing protein, partial [Pseudolabrys sp.]|nr:TonB-dependent receptor plug domain-containing protein [Pseudolabrys sp.]